MAGNKLFEEQLHLITPHTYNALTKLVMAMSGVVKNSGKKTLFGRDKGQESYSKFLITLQKALQSMVLDGVISEATSNEETLEKLGKKLYEFSMAHPNWQDAYGFASMFFNDKKEDAIAAINRLR